MKNNIFKLLLASGLIIAVVSGCTKKLDLTPTNDLTADKVYSTPEGYKESLAKIYLALAMPGNVGNNSSGGWGGSPDIPREILSDEGNSDFLRGYWYLQCLSTDEAGWTYHNNTDPLGIHQLTWSSINQTVAGAYYRAFFQITLINDFIRQTADDKIAARGITGADADNIHHYKAEARFLRAYQYWVLMDLFGNPPFVTENDPVGVGIPKQISRSDLFNYIDSELVAIQPDLVAPHQNDYGRADEAADWALLARMYLNAEVYTGKPRYTDAITYCSKIIQAGYTLHPDYTQLMLADNNLNTDEFILTIPYDGTYTQTYGGTTVLVHGPSGVPATTSGTNGSWNCIRITQQFVGLFGNGDMRGQFYTGYNETAKKDQQLIMNQLLDVLTDGYSSTKFRNVTRTGAPAPHADVQGNFSDVDFPLFRLGEIYLTYAEAVLRGGTGGDKATALGYINQLRTRAYGNASGNITESQLTLDFILDERGRELFWECIRRTDLIRYDRFTTGSYLWAWKGGVQSGTAVDSKYNLFPIPSTDLSSNPNLKQNPGY